MAELAGRVYVPKLYKVDGARAAVVAFLEQAVEDSGGRVVYSSFADHRVAPVYLGAEDQDGGRYGMLVYPFTTTKRLTKNRPDSSSSTTRRHRFVLYGADWLRLRPNAPCNPASGIDGH